MSNAPQNPLEPAHTRRRRPHGPLSILLAEDDLELRRFLAASLGAAGHVVREVADGAELLRVTGPGVLERGAYDVIVSDIVMPGASGVATLRQLRDDPAAPLIVLMTAFADPDVHSWAKQLGAVATFDKPFDVDDLKTLLVNLHGAIARSRTPTQP